MKFVSLTFIFLSLITFKQCGGASEHEDIDLNINPVYSGGSLSATPYIIYEGEDPTTFQFGSSIAWIEKITLDDEVLYEYEGEDVDVDQQTTLEEDGERTGFTVEVDTEPGSFDVHMVSEFMVETEAGELQEFRHQTIRTVEVKNEEE
ncbi:hypothetical protein CR203_22545 [Salipaludibacillus neizhouensis]|uniref:Uncharacterized protein n=1 Tax=Salipaludibacillus neizhouensis TaxID=885475 RepID=A0A3A9JY50_9BACI|nr:hypothetical protein [Salipaludibacillus neizhouensis]RKL65129.1 hypothetical protein CR203_22545 [Salipaludibacillus neizhouensis]